MNKAMLQQTPNRKKYQEFLVLLSHLIFAKKELS